MAKDAKIYVAGHRGMVGSAIVRELERQGYTNIITRTHKELDLTRQEAVEAFFAQEKPEYVFLAAAKVGGIVANQEALADFMYDNMTLEMNVIHSAWKNGVKKFEFLGSSCIYPRMAPQPMKESCLLTSELEKTNEAYALAKISGLKYCEFLNRQYGTDYISVMPTNLYGPNDNYHPTHSHVLPALIRRFHEAKEQNLPYVTCWGDGSPLREFLYVDDLANLCVFLMNNYSGNETVNAGTGKELTIKELTEKVAKIVGYNGEIRWDPSKPNGTPRKLLDVSKSKAMGWEPKTSLDEGIRLTYHDFLTPCISSFYPAVPESGSGRFPTTSAPNSLSRFSRAKTAATNPWSSGCIVRSKPWTQTLRLQSRHPNRRFPSSVTRSVKRRESR